MNSNTPVRMLADVATDIRKHWRPVWYGAVPYLDAMQTMNSIEEDYGMDSGRSIVVYFLSNAQQFKGPEARRLKGELKSMLKR